jgi:hypothetical protein
MMLVSLELFVIASLVGFYTQTWLGFFATLLGLGVFFYSPAGFLLSLGFSVGWGFMGYAAGRVAGAGIDAPGVREGRGLELVDAATARRSCAYENGSGSKRCARRRSLRGSAFAASAAECWCSGGSRSPRRSCCSQVSNWCHASHSSRVANRGHGATGVGRVSDVLGRGLSAPLGGSARTLVNQELSSVDDAGGFDPRPRAKVTAAPSGPGELA